MANPIGFLETQKKEILRCFSDDNVKTVVLFGEAGVGKTWMAKEMSNSASLKGSYGTIWVVPGYNSEGISLVEYIAIQLSIIPDSEEWDEYDNAETEHQEREKNLKQEIRKKLDWMKDAKLEENSYLLVVLDDINDHKEILADLNGLLSCHANLLKVLITTRDSDIGIGSEGNGDAIRKDASRSFEIKFLSDVDSSNLLQNRVKEEVKAKLLSDVDSTRFERLCAAIGKCSSGHPGAIIMIAEALNHVREFELKDTVEEVACIMASADIKTLLQHVYEMLPSTLNKCCWYCRYLFLHHDSSIHYNELITHWLLEGYFDHHDHIEKAYEEAHRSLMTLKSRGFLRGKENGYVCMDSDALRVTDRRREGLSGSACVGMASMLNDTTLPGLGRVIKTDGMIKTSSQEWGVMSTLLIDGARFCREAPDIVFRQLKVLVILNPMFKELPLPILELKELQVFVLRGGVILESVDAIHKLTNLLVLEISGARKVEEICDDLFGLMKDIRSLNLSGVGIKRLPSSLLKRSELRWLILRNCPNLEQLCDDSLLNGKEAAEVLSWAKLEVLDLSGSDSFQRIQVETLYPLKKLQTLNLSKTKIECLPTFRGLKELTRLLLSDCPYLLRLPTLVPLLELEIFDLSRTSLKETLLLPGLSRFFNRPKKSSLSHLLLSGCVDLLKLPSTRGLQCLEELNLSDASFLEEFEDDSFRHLVSLRRLILSNAKIKALPSLPQHSELRLLSLKNCKSLTELQDLRILQELEVLDLSGCCELEISTDSFQGMSHLKTINLSETKIKSLPQDRFPSSLCHLIIRNCANWNNLPYLEDLPNLEVLDLSGAKSLINVKPEFLSHMSKLRILNLSEIQFEQLPSLSLLTNLRELSLRGCSCRVPKLDALKKLELLDLSGTKVQSLPTIDTFSNLQQLLLRDCADLESLEKLESLAELEVLDISGTKIKEFPYEVSDLASLRELNLQDMKHIKEINWKKIKYIPEEFNLGGCGSLSPEIAESSEWPSISICGTGFFQFVEENPMLWDTCFQKFHFSVWLPENSDGRIYELGDGGLLRDIKSQGAIPHPEEPGRYLEIHGTGGLSSLPEHVLKRADHISLMNDSSFSHLSQLVKESLRSIKSCWFDRCTDIKSIVNGEEDARASGKLEFLNLCNLPSLKCVCDDTVQSEVFGDLKSLWVDCCPKLSNIFPLPKLPKKLEKLQIKYCDEMTELFNPNVSSGCNLHNLDLLELPKLGRVGVRMDLLQVLKVRECPNLKSLEEVLGEAENLHTLHISYAAGLETICNQEVKPGHFKSLNQLKIESCPLLKNVFSSSGLPPKLTILEINSCESLETIFTGSLAGSSLARLRLCGLPSLSSTVLKVPPQCKVICDKNCPKLQIRPV